MQKQSEAASLSVFVIGLASSCAHELCVGQLYLEVFKRGLHSSRDKVKQQIYQSSSLASPAAARMSFALASCTLRCSREACKETLQTK